MGWALENTDLERVGCSLHCGGRRGEWSRIFPDVWVADSACRCCQKARWSRAFRFL